MPLRSDYMRQTIPGLSRDTAARLREGPMEGDIANRDASLQYYRDARRDAYQSNVRNTPTIEDATQGFESTTLEGEGDLANLTGASYGADPALGGGPSVRSVGEASRYSGDYAGRVAGDFARRGGQLRGSPVQVSAPGLLEPLDYMDAAP